MSYSEIVFRGNYMFSERARVGKQRLIAAAFTAHQLLQVKVQDLPPWDKYLKQLGLSDTPKISKDDLHREADQAMKNAEIALEKLRGNNGSR